MHIDKNGWLIQEPSDPHPVIRIPSIRSTPLSVKEPLACVWHWTAGPDGSKVLAEALAQEIRAYTRGKDRPASWHVLVSESGKLYQSVPFTMGSWHVGKSGVIGTKRFTNINTGTIGIELENAGRLEKVGTEYFREPWWLNPLTKEPNPKLKVRAESAVAVGNAYYDSFPPPQEAAAQALLKALVVRYKWPREACTYGHLHFDSPRKADPGPLWLDQVLPRILTSLFGPGPNIRTP